MDTKLISLIYLLSLGLIFFEKINILFNIVLNGIFILDTLRFMSKNLNSKNIENDASSTNSKESDYQSLITRLKDVKTTIALLEKTIFK